MREGGEGGFIGVKRREGKVGVRERVRVEGQVKGA